MNTTIKPCGSVVALLLTIFSMQHHGAEILVKWRNGPESAAALAANLQFRATVIRNFPAIGWQLVRVPGDMEADLMIGNYSRLPDVLAVEWNSPVESAVRERASAQTVQQFNTAGNQSATSVSTNIVPNDPRFRDQWYLRKIQAPGAWSTTTGGSNVVVAVIDGGIDYTHPDLAGNIWRNPGETGFDLAGNNKERNGLDDDNNGYVDDVHGANFIAGNGDPLDVGSYLFDPASRVYHGTSVSGVIGAVANNTLGMAGVTWSCKIMALRAMGGDFANSKNLSSSSFTANIIAAYDYLIAMKRRNVNVRIAVNSWSSTEFSAAISDALSIAGDNGVLSIFAAGNNGWDCNLFTKFAVAYQVPSVLAVAATTESDALDSFSNFGASTVALGAPGVNILTNPFTEL